MTFGDLLKRILRCEHEWLDATCTTPKTCSLCGKTEGEALGHIEEIIEGKAADCTNTGLTNGVRCTRCGEILVEQQVIPALGHNYVSEVIKPATCAEEGLRKYTCTRCGDTYEEVIPVLAHKQATREENRIGPDCTNNGSYETVTYCTVCNEEISRKTTTLAALGHDYGD
jgi:DNA-directed RNA polymerase subunit RPC12/RpoP